MNKNMIPFDERKPMETSGLRLGSPALSTRGMGPDEMRTIAGLLDKALASSGDSGKLSAIKSEVRQLCKQFPMPAH